MSIAKVLFDDDEDGVSEKSKSSQSNDAVLASYKELIREQVKKYIARINFVARKRSCEQQKSSNVGNKSGYSHK